MTTPISLPRPTSRRGHRAAFLALALGLASCASATRPGEVATPSPRERPTIVLVHGAFAESASWNGVIADLQARRFRVVAVANPLRGLKSDAGYVTSVVRSIDGPVVLVGHSYAGSVISNVPPGGQVKALVFVAALAPERGESTGDLVGKFPGGTLGAALAPPVELPGGVKDLYVRQDSFGEQFAADVPSDEARTLAATQRPIAESALGEPSGDPTWKSTPSWFIYGDGDRNIPAAALAFMADRAHARETVVVPGGSHVVMVSHAHEVADLVAHAADAR